MVIVAGSLLAACSPREESPAASDTASSAASEKPTRSGNDDGFEPEYRKLVDSYNQKTGARQMSASEVQALLDRGAPLVILDVREPRETAVSTLPGARRVPQSTLASFRETIPEGTPIIAYCTAGYRSGFAAVQLERQLGRPVHNLDGGIVAWFNAGGSVVNGEGETVHEIHAYGPAWERFVRSRAPKEEKR